MPKQNTRKSVNNLYCLITIYYRITQFLYLNKWILIIEVCTSCTIRIITGSVSLSCMSNLSFIDRFVITKPLSFFIYYAKIWLIWLSYNCKNWLVQSMIIQVLCIKNLMQSKSKHPIVIIIIVLWNLTV